MCLGVSVGVSWADVSSRSGSLKIEESEEDWSEGDWSEEESAEWSLDVLDWRTDAVISYKVYIKQ